jgi:hypothetical protein
VKKHTRPLTLESAVHQAASASLTAVFSVGMLFAAHFFTEYRSSRIPAIAPIQSPVLVRENEIRRPTNRQNCGMLAVCQEQIASFSRSM